MSSQALRTRLAELRAQEEVDRTAVNLALSQGLILVYRSGTLPAGRRVRSLYDSREGGGTWSIDTTGSHWCHGSVPTDWAQSAKAFLVALPNTVPA